MFSSHRIISLLVLTVFMAVSCVPPRQMAELVEKNLKMEHDGDSLKGINEKLTVENTEFKANMKNCQQEVAKLEKDSILRNEFLSRIDQEYKTLADRYNKLKESQEALINGSERETKRLLQELQTTQNSLQGKEDKLKELERQVESKRRSLDELQTEMEKQKYRLVELERILNRKDSVMKALKTKISAALLGFEGQGLTVTRKNGKVYVSLDEKLLFSSGSYAISENGIDALKKLGKVLEQNTDISIMVEGHTDDVPFISNAEIKDNWDLSNKRAAAVVRILLDNSKIAPKRLTTAGRSQYSPVEVGKTPDARGKNRRTEIILTPNLDELYNILEN